MERETLKSRLGFILLSAGCAIGIGNVWRFPYIAGQYGGGYFVLFYLICLLIMGAMMGLAGSYMPLSGSSMFTERMTDGRGFLCLTAILVGRADPFRTMLLAMLFGYSSALTLVLSSYGLPSQILSMLPYLMVMAVLLITGIKKYRGIDISSEAI